MILVIASVFLFAFVYSEGVNQGVDWANAKFSEKAKLTLPHMPDKPFQLGLDLLGGTHLVYEADLSKVESADRADAMEGIRDVNQAISMIGETPFIEFKEEAPDAQRLVEEFQAKQAAGQTDVLAEIELQDKLFLSTALNR